MKTKIKITILAIMLTIGTLQLKAQDGNLNTLNNPNYKNAIGLRAGETSGITFKHFMNNNRAFEGILGLWPNAISVTGLVEQHAGAFSVSGLNWYYGFGGHFVIETEVYNNENYRFDRGEDLGIGIDGIVGLEYKIIPIPFAISLDVKPFIEFNTDGRLYTSIDPSLGIKFTF